MADKSGYFTLINSKSKTFLTAISENALAAKGKYVLMVFHICNVQTIDVRPFLSAPARTLHKK